MELIAALTCELGLLLPLSPGSHPQEIALQEQRSLFNQLLKKLIGLPMVETLLILGIKTLYLICQLIGTCLVKAQKDIRLPLGWTQAANCP